MDELTLTATISLIISIVLIILFIIMVINIVAIRNDSKKLIKMADESLKKFGVIRFGQCPHCSHEFSTFKNNGEKVKCKWCYKEFEVSI